jgi:hypothetical protein
MDGVTVTLLDAELLERSLSARGGRSIAYDFLRERTVLFGEEANVKTIRFFARIWEWDGSTWL